MTRRNKLTPSELDKLLAMYQSITTIITFFAGFVFVTIPLIIFSTEISFLYGRLILYLLLTSLLVFTTTIDLYHSAVLRVFQQTSPNAVRIFRKYREPRIVDQFMGIAMFFASSSISFMLLPKGQEWAIEALIWFLISIGRPVLGHFLAHRPLRQPNARA